MVTSPDDEGLTTSDTTEEAAQASANSTVAKGAMILAIGTLVSRILGWYREKLLLGIYGDSDIAGAYKSAFQVPDLLYYLLAGGALSAAFIPVFSGYLAKKNQADANRVGSSIANLMLIAIAIGTVIEIILAPYLVHFIAPGYAKHPAIFDLTVNLTRVLCFMVFFTALSALFTGMLNAYHHFLATTLVWNTYNLGIIFGLLYLRNFNWGPHGIYGVAFGVIIGAFSMAVIQFPVLLKYGFRYLPTMDLKHEGVRKVLVLFMPVVIAFFCTQFSMMNIPLIRASSLGPPAVTDIQAATRLVLLPLGIFAVAISTAAFPRLAQQVVMGETAAFRGTLSQALKAILLLTIPATIGMFVLAEPLTFLLWGGDEFGAGGVRAAAYALSFFVWALLGISVMQIINRAFFSLHKNWEPLLVAFGVVIANWFLSQALMQTTLQYGGITLATSITLLIGSLVLIDILRRRLGGIEGRALLVMTSKVLLASLLMGGAVYAFARLEPLVPRLRYDTSAGAPTAQQVLDLQNDRIRPYLNITPPYVPPSNPEIGKGAKLVVPRMKVLVQVGASILVGGGVYLLLLWLLRVREFEPVLARVLRRFRRRTPAPTE